MFGRFTGPVRRRAARARHAEAAMFERFTDAARSVLALAQDEARLLNHNFIGTEHILLGLLREGDGRAAQALGTFGIHLDDARQQVAAPLRPAPSAITGSAPFTPRTKKVLEMSLREALQLGHDFIGTEHLLLALVREGEGVAAQVLVGLGADLSQVRQKVTQLMAGPLVAGGGVLGGAEAGGEARAMLRPRGPRCSRCSSEIAASARFRTIQVPPDETCTDEGPRRATVFYCSHCGALLSPPSGPAA